MCGKVKALTCEKVSIDTRGVTRGQTLTRVDTDLKRLVRTAAIWCPPTGTSGSELAIVTPDLRRIADDPTSQTGRPGACAEYSRNREETSAAVSVSLLVEKAAIVPRTG